MRCFSALMCVAGLVCASFAPAGAKEAEPPKWVSNPASFCSESAFCAVGSGKTLKAATADARAGIAKIFQAQVKASFSSTTEADNDTVSSSAKANLSEESDVLLKSVEIKENFTRNDTVYALAFMDKAKVARIISAQINDIDSKMEAFLDDDQAASARMAEKLYEKRRDLNELMIVLMGKGIAERFSYDDVFKNRKEKTKGGDICLHFSGLQTEAFKRTIKNVLKNNGYVISNECSFTISVKLSAEEEPFDIDGLHKYAFTLSLKAKDTGTGKQTSLFETTLSEAGRNEKQTLPFILEQIKQELTDAVSDFSF